MSSKSLPTPAQVLAKFYEAETIYMAAAPKERDIAGMASCLSEDFRLYQSPDLPYGGTYEGRSGFKKWSDDMASYFDRLEVIDPQVFEKSGSDSVVVSSTLKLRVRKNGVELVGPLLQAMKVDREKGLLTEIRPFYWNVKGLNEAVQK
ncbi:hypothetical protein M409DRAFT_18193 [Zasmidium cellare ATCC 36951]|uniref:SnoaL-like domain-containing protein n=1 Tax=Zasmidium cellare ATCC 36951 TaxID=1080233 RepID=A0A6A6D1B9_ZASCE|nr:uncharacterized protein M409DRAFT_18193 [Zasmidium cellare ATCC 36951]KAF2171962.1 hypothetical protein M409DRAFT_18193 [Zasmidium cellare ATCC 36951]